MDAIKWFPLDRIGGLESCITTLVAKGPLLRRRDALAMALRLHGLRVGEVIQTRNRELFEATRMLSVATIKKGRPRKVPLDRSTIDAIRRWQADAPFADSAPDSLILPNTRGRQCRRETFERLARLVTTELGASLTFHALRHTFAMLLYAATKDLFLVQRMLGHRSVQDVGGYTRLS